MNKKPVISLINEANTIVNNHHSMTCAGMCEELSKLKERLVTLLNTFDEVDPEDGTWEALDLLLDDANDAVKRVSDALESHHGGGVTQL